MNDEEREKQRRWEEIKFLKVTIVCIALMFLGLLGVEYIFLTEKLGVSPPVAIILTILSVPAVILLDAI